MFVAFSFGTLFRKLLNPSLDRINLMMSLSLPIYPTPISVIPMQFASVTPQILFFTHWKFVNLTCFYTVVILFLYSSFRLSTELNYILFNYYIILDKTEDIVLEDVTIFAYDDVLNNNNGSRSLHSRTGK